MEKLVISKLATIAQYDDTKLLELFLKCQEQIYYLPAITLAFSKARRLNETVNEVTVMHT